MRAMAWCAGVAATGVVLVAATAVDCLTSFAGGDVEVDPLVRGDLAQLFASATFRASFPSFGGLAEWFAAGPMALVFAGAVAIALAWRRCRAAPSSLPFALLLVGAVPYAIGAFALRDNAVPEDAGPWLLWMIVGPGWAAIAALVALAVLLLVDRPTTRVPAPTAPPLARAN